MAEYLYTNNAASTLASGINDTALSLDVAPGTGSLFPNPSAGQQFNLTLIDGSGNLEIVKVTARSTDTFTIVRAQESTVAIPFALGDRVELRVTAEGMMSMVQESAVQTLTNKTIDANGTGNSILNTGVDEWVTVSGTDTIVATANASITAYATGQRFAFKAAGANTGPVTINVNSIGTKDLKKNGTDALGAGDIPAADAMIVVTYDGTNFQLSSGSGSGGASAGGCIYENNRTITANYTMTKSGMTVGPLTVNTGVTLTVNSGERLVVL